MDTSVSASRIRLRQEAGEEQSPAKATVLSAVVVLLAAGTAALAIGLAGAVLALVDFLSARADLAAVPTLAASTLYVVPGIAALALALWLCLPGPGLPRLDAEVTNPIVSRARSTCGEVEHVE